MSLITASIRGGDLRASAETPMPWWPVPWWSLAKTVLASAALVLVAQGRLQLDVPIGGKRYTLRHLLGHRAGLRCYGGLRAYHDAVAAGDPPWSGAELLRRVGAGGLTDALGDAPGQGWEYSNVGYLLVRHLIEAEADAPLDVALERLVFRPLDVPGVTLAREPADLDATAWGNAKRYHPGWVYHGLLVGPALSAALFLHRLLAGHLLPPDLLTAMQEAYRVGGGLSGRPWTTANYGLGLMIGEGVPPGSYIGHTGGGPGSTAAVYRCADTGCTAAAFAPIDDSGEVERRAMALAATGADQAAVRT